MKIEDIDWDRLWQEARRKGSWKRKDRHAWNKKASSFAARHAGSLYVKQFISLLKPNSDWSVLDVGSGPGTLTVPLAKLVKKVTAIDYSSKMLDLLKEQIESQTLSNVILFEASWEDDWQRLGIFPHDVLIASRSLAVDDLAGILRKADSFASKTVILCDRIGPTPFDPDAFEAIGRPFEPGPDYIFTLNILYQLGIHATVDHISLPLEEFYSSKEQALNSYSWMFENLTNEEENKLAAFVDSRMKRIDKSKWRLVRNIPQKWAFIRWNKGSEA